MEDLRPEALTRRSALALPLLLAACAPPDGARAQAGGAGPAERREVWRDPSRARDVPVLIRTPAGAGPHPVVLVSHGLGGSREGLGYLGRALASAGYIAVHLQHAGTDEAVWRGPGADRFGGLAAAALDVEAAGNRLLDCRFALDRLPAGADPARAAVAGHSYGAWTVQHLLGQRMPGGDRGLGLPETRLRAGVALSPIPTRGLPPRLAYGGFVSPILHVTGTEDHGFVEGVRAPQRRQPYEASTNPGALVVLRGATHAAFADEPAAGARYADPTYHARAAALSVAFLDAVLRGDAAARAAFPAGAEALLGPGDEFLSRGLA